MVDGNKIWLVRSLKLHVSFAEYALFYTALLQKRPVILQIVFYRVATISTLLKITGLFCKRAV